MSATPKTDAPAVSNVSDTARWSAYYRALESARSDALFSDPLAERLAGEQGKEIARRAPYQMGGGWPVVARTVMIDEMIEAGIAEGCDCVVNLAAGLDTRPYRLELPASLRWVEVDLPGIVEEKAALLASEPPRCNLVQLKVDLSDATARAQGLDEALTGCNRALVLTEGLLMYLDEATVAGLARKLHRPQVAWWILETVSPPVRDMMMKSMKAEFANAPLDFAPANGVAFFEEQGWMVCNVRSIVHEAHRLGRLPWLLNLMMMLPVPKPDPRNVGKARWSGIACLAPAFPDDDAGNSPSETN